MLDEFKLLKIKNTISKPAENSVSFCSNIISLTCNVELIINGIFSSEQTCNSKPKLNYETYCSLNFSLMNDSILLKHDWFLNIFVLMCPPRVCRLALTTFFKTQYKFTNWYTFMLKYMLSEVKYMADIPKLSSYLDKFISSIANIWAGCSAFTLSSENHLLTNLSTICSSSVL